MSEQPPQPAPTAHGHVRSYPITPPLSGDRSYGAKAVVTYGGRVFSLHEHWGRSEGEARQKAQIELNEWLAENAASVTTVEPEG